MFQSTPPHGRRPGISNLAVRQSLFQSTPPHGRRPEPSKEEDAPKNVSIHASAREATVRLYGIDCPEKVSIHASAREATVTGVGLRG